IEYTHNKINSNVEAKNMCLVFDTFLSTTSIVDNEFLNYVIKKYIYNDIGETKKKDSMVILPKKKTNNVEQNLIVEKVVQITTKNDVSKVQITDTCKFEEKRSNTVNKLMFKSERTKYFDKNR